MTNFSLPGGDHPLVMGILNVTPDSFSDGGVHFDRSVAIEAALKMEDAGADVIDVGGESTRPGAESVPAEVEMDRVIPVIEAIRRRSQIPISIDTMKASVAEAAIEAGAGIVNDVTALRFDPAMRRVILERGVSVILMHMRGEPRTMQTAIHYDDVVEEVKSELAAWRSEAIQSGIEPAKILIDPGIGFGKTFDHNLELLGATDRFSSVAPTVIGASRKAFVGSLTGRSGGRPRLAGSLAAVASAVLGGAVMVRVHDVEETVDFLKVFSAIRRASRR